MREITFNDFAKLAAKRELGPYQTINRLTRNTTMKNCTWNCGRKTQNHSGICTLCWKAAELSRTMGDEGYNAWLEGKRVEIGKAKPRTEAQKAHVKRLNAKRAMKSAKDLPATPLLHSETVWRLPNPQPSEETPN